VENAAAYIWGPTSQAFPPILNNISVHMGDAVLTAQQILAIGVAVLLTVTFEVIRKGTLFGKVSMAIAADPEMASAIGANTTVVAIIAFAISGLFAGIAGVLIGPSTFANPYLGGTFGTYGFIAMMIGGGTEKPAAAMFGGLLLGVLAEGANATINSQASDWFPFLVLVVILIVSPSGLFSSSSAFLRLWPRRPAAARG
jgi:branched-chain amino acid transport system permease protein